MSSTTDILSVINDAVDFVWPAATALAAVGVLTMALLEIVQELLHLKEKHRRRMFLKIVSHEHAGCNSIACCGFKQLLLLLEYGPKPRPFGGEVQGLIDKLADAFGTALDDAKEYEKLIRLLAPRIGSELLDDLRNGAGIDPAQRQTFVAAKAHAMSLNQHFLAAVKQQLKREWQRVMQIAAVVASILTIGICGYLLLKGTDPDVQTILFWFIVAVFGGTVAPVAKDIVTALKTYKERVK